VLSNGHVLVGHLAKALKAAALQVPTGSVVELELSPCDLCADASVGVKPKA
jgi:translation initiation factor IF-1